MNDEIYDLQERVSDALSTGTMTRDEAVAELVRGGFEEALAIDFVAVIVDDRGE